MLFWGILLSCLDSNGHTPLGWWTKLRLQEVHPAYIDFLLAWFGYEAGHFFLPNYMYLASIAFLHSAANLESLLVLVSKLEMV